jgi:hypothetical protein
VNFERCTVELFRRALDCFGRKGGDGKAVRISAGIIHTQLWISTGLTTSHTCGHGDSQAVRCGGQGRYTQRRQGGSQLRRVFLLQRCVQIRDVLVDGVAELKVILVPPACRVRCPPAGVYAPC